MMPPIGRVITKAIKECSHCKEIREGRTTQADREIEEQLFRASQTLGQVGAGTPVAPPPVDTWRTRTLEEMAQQIRPIRPTAPRLATHDVVFVPTAAQQTFTVGNTEPEVPTLRTRPLTPEDVG
jgi:hypothetical protein